MTPKRDAGSNTELTLEGKMNAAMGWKRVYKASSGTSILDSFIIFLHSFEDSGQAGFGLGWSSFAGFGSSVFCFGLLLPSSGFGSLELCDFGSSCLPLLLRSLPHLSFLSNAFTRWLPRPAPVPVQWQLAFTSFCIQSATMSPTNGTKSTFKGAKTVQTRLSKFINSVVGSRVEKTRSPPKVPVEPTRLVQQQLFAGLTTPAVTDYSPSLHDGGQETVGSGDFSTNCSVKVLQKHSSTFFQGTIQKAPQGEKGKEAALKLYRKAASYPVINTSTVVKCEDGRPLLYFIKGAMFAGMSADKQHSLTAQSINAIKELIATYPPIAPKKDDSRVFDQAEQKRKWRGKGKAYGRYVSFYSSKYVN